ncbi:hypothetical protein Q9Q94_05430 [Uliginosibacterium sp. 31-16]|uniref:hypothetical protein n=1 Tax=Uliginosibacterium sp. 31-16 TaxID=3068315 RepID=UPI00273FBED4|nr:hypothetical protein [Uliginosibacterium sp. 31-16]MDP5238960.1 hypothetical protein [Uliginosibacterium sp. 31-16]
MNHFVSDLEEISLNEILPFLHARKNFSVKMLHVFLGASALARFGQLCISMTFIEHDLAAADCAVNLQAFIAKQDRSKQKRVFDEFEQFQ